MGPLERFPLTDQDAVRFWAKVDDSTGDGECWAFTGGRDKNGYGHFYLGGGRDDPTYVEAHRVAYTLEKGVPPGHVLHSLECVTRLCCNPDHLRDGTHAENMNDRRLTGTGGRAGGGAPKITDDASRQIAGLAAAGVNYSEIARRFSVTPFTARYHHRKHANG